MIKTTNARPMKDAKITLTLSEKQILYYRMHPVEACLDLLGVRLIWLQRIALKMIWFKRFPLLNLSRGVGKSWIIAIVTVLYALLYPKTKVGIIAPVFRQANYVFDAIDDLYSNSEFLQSSTKRSPSRGTAQSVLKFHNSSFVEALPVGDGNKIRGRRYHFICIDEYAQMDESIIKLVIRPMLNIKRAGRANKLLVASTAYYRWNHYFTVYLYYIKMMLEGNIDYGIAEFDYTDVQNTPNSPYQIDDEIIEMQKNDMTEEEFMMENRCTPGDSVILTSKGAKQAEHVLVGDKVLTHKGRFRKVTKVFKRNYKGLMYEIRSRYRRNKTRLTPGHSVYNIESRQWVEVDKINKYYRGFTPKFFNVSATKRIVKISNYTKGLLYKDRIYHTINRKITQEFFDYMRTEGKKETDRFIMDKFPFTKDTVRYHRKLRLPSNSLSNRIRIDENFCSLVGWYMAKGQLTKSGIEFHFNVNEENYVNEVQNLILHVFGLKSTVRTYKSVSTVVVHNRIVSKLFYKLFGKGYNNKNLPSWFLSLTNKLLKIFVRSIWLGDGYHTSSCGIELSNSLLIEQLNFILHRLDIIGSVNHRLNRKEYNIKGVKGYDHGVSKIILGGSSRRNLCNIVNYKYRYSKWYRKNPRHNVYGEGISNNIVESTKSYFKGLVYNYEVEEDNSYVCGGIAVHNCLFPIDSVGFISARLIDQCEPKLDPLEPETNQPEDQHLVEYFMGIDAARVAGGDNFAMVIVKSYNGKRQLVNVKTLNGSTYQTMISVIREGLLNFNITRIHVGAGGGGYTIKDLLAEPWKNKEGESMLPILDIEDPDHANKEGLKILKLINETAQKNTEMYMRLKSDLEHKRIEFPMSVSPSAREEKIIAVLYKEIISTKRELLVLEAIPRNNYFKFTVPSKYGKDRATALILSIDAVDDYYKADKKEMSEELAIGFFIA